MGWARSSFACACVILAACRPQRTPAPERMLASQGDDSSRIATPSGPPETPEPPHDEDPDLQAAAADEPADEAPEPAPRAEAGVPIASRYAGLDRASCLAELDRRHVAYAPVGEARGVLAPLRLNGPLDGVTFRSSLPAAKARVSPIDIYDCRLVLALDDFARLLSKHDIVEVVHLSVYRPVSPRVPLKGLGRRHSGALAIDAAIFKTKDGHTMSVEKDFHGRIGAKPCPAPSDASELRKIACEANDARLFNVLLTPDYNWAHRNHFHLEVTAGVRWTLVR